MFKFFSPVQRGFKKRLANRTKNAEIAYSAQMRTLRENRSLERKSILQEFENRLKEMWANYNTRKQEILDKCINDIFTNVA